MNPFGKLAATVLATGMLLAAATVPAAAGTAPAKPAAQTTASTTAVTEDQWLTDVGRALAGAPAYLSETLAASSGKHPAIVLDIDNTSLESYFHPLTPPAVPQVLGLADYAHAHGAAVFFISARPDIIDWITTDDLERAGYPVDGLYTRDFLDLFEPVQDFKTSMREAIEDSGYTIVVNIGNNTSDLAGGHAERTFKLPDYNGLLS